ncbi:uncharacterized protein [Pagrus major]|uniref:uncharacterized protein n=1 Tax=Pagrus major TaxID=143350 RepID=UPI003CC8D1A2
MALGLLLRVSWICFLLFDGGAGSPAIKGYGYPSVSDTHNIGDDGEDEGLSYDQSSWAAPNYQPTGPVYTSYNKPAAAQQPAWAPSQQNGAAERIVNGSPRDWGLENIDKPLVFPLPSNPAKPQTGPVQPQTSFSDGMPATQSAADSTYYASPTAYYAPASTSQAAKAPSFEPVDAGYGVVDFNTDSSAAGANIYHLTYEDVFQYPSENVAPQGYGTVSNAAGGYDRAQPVYPSSLGSFNNFGQTGYQPQNEVPLRPQKPANTQKVATPQRVSEPIFPPAPPPSYIIQSRNAYKQARYLLSHTKYSPEYPQPVAASSKGAKGPAPSQPAAPKGVKNPPRIKW